MPTLQLSRIPGAKTAMLIRRPPQEVCEAFVDPAIATQFWFTKSSGRLAAGHSVQWDWEMYGISIQVRTLALEPGKRLVVEFPGAPNPTTVEWKFDAAPGGHTFVQIEHSGFMGSGDEVVQQALDSMGGFCWVLAGLKALLEHKLRLNLVADRFPQGKVAG